MAAKKKNGLGKGLDALFMDNSIEENANVISLKINDIEPNREQPRKVFDESALKELSDSIATHGVIQPLLVRPMSDGSYQLIAGERRWRASRMAGLTEVPVVIREMTDSEAMELALVENLQREDLSPIEEAEGLQLLMDRYSLTQEQASQRVGKSRPAVANALRLLSLPQSILTMVKDGSLSAGHGRAILSLGDEKSMLNLAKAIKEKGLSVRDTEKAVKAMLKPESKKEAKPKKRDTFYDEVELSIYEAIGRRAKIKTENSKKGSIEIEFFGKEDLIKLIGYFEKIDY